ncbi:MAG: LysE family translocator [Actinophytocola sp.]|uniref:LysE family translocator n=1 Tax=Actinophytocola sp. TaxID=1872138 RepID=UPI003D6A1694
MTVTQLLAFGGVLLLAVMAPGPDFVIVTRNAVLSGRRAGMACAAGIAAGGFAWAFVTALGIAGLLAASAVAFTVVKIAGAGYLVLLGVRVLLAARRGGYETPEAGSGRMTGAHEAFRQGLLSNLLNPKVAVFFTALLPQFVPTTASPVDHLLLAATAPMVSLLWFVVLSNVVSALRRFLTKDRVRRTLDAVMGTLLVALGLRLAAQ